MRRHRLIVDPLSNEARLGVLVNRSLSRLTVPNDRVTGVAWLGAAKGRVRWRPIRDSVKHGPA